MGSRRKTGARTYGDPRKRKPLAGDLARVAQPTGLNDPRRLGGDIAGPSGSRDHGAVVLDTTDAVLLEHTTVCTVDAVRQGAFAEQVIFATLAGRINKKSDHVQVGFLFGPDGAAAIITELLALGDRFGAELLSDMTRRLTDLHQGKHVDLRFLRAAIDNAIDAAEDAAGEALPSQLLACGCPQWADDGHPTGPGCPAYDGPRDAGMEEGGAS